MKFFNHIVFACSAVVLFAAAAAAQSRQPAIFVANNGNLEGSVTSFTVNPDGTLNFVQKLITGVSDWGTNCYVIAVSPDGSRLAVGHANSDQLPGRISIIGIDEDAGLTLLGGFQVLRTPLDLLWIDNEYIAVARASLSQTNFAIVYRYDWETNELVFVDSRPAGNFSTSVAIHPSAEYLYVNNTSGGNTIRVYRINADRTLTDLQTHSTGSTYPMGLGISPNGRWIFGGGGISDGSNKVTAHGVALDGLLSALPNQPFVSPGASPKQVTVSDDNAVAFAGHGGDGTVRSFLIDAGQLTATGGSFSTGGQGGLGFVRTMGNLVFAADRYTYDNGFMGVQVWSFDSATGAMSLVQMIETQGIQPHDIAVWAGASEPCVGDLNGDGAVDVLDLLALLDTWGKCPRGKECPADLNGDGAVDVLDLLMLLDAWGKCP
jgi:6-phosphogluconolactonase (cycloisomerase 2 family)